MTAKELIAELQLLVDDFGDCEVMFGHNIAGGDGVERVLQDTAIIGGATPDTIFVLE